jgi:hypothetical protein
MILLISNQHILMVFILKLMKIRKLNLFILTFLPRAKCMESGATTVMSVTVAEKS